jgi:hypothetical protein
MFIEVVCIGSDDVLRRTFINVNKIEAIAEKNGVTFLGTSDGMFKVTDTVDDVMKKINAAIAV